MGAHLTFAEEMNKTRIFAGLAVLISAICPIYVLSRVTYGVRYGILTNIYEGADMVFPPLSNFLWPFGALDWWGYLTPLAFAVGVAARIQSPIRISILVAYLTFSVAQAVLIIAGFLPFAKFAEVMGYPAPAPYPTLPLLVNLSMVAASVIFAVLSVIRCAANQRKSNKSGEQDGGGNALEPPSHPSTAPSKSRATP